MLLRFMCYITAGVGVLMINGNWQTGYKLWASKYDTLKIIGKRDCIRECLHRMSCLSVNYNKKDHECEINQHSRSQLPYHSFYKSDMYDYGDKQDFISDMDKACNEAHCADYQKCVLLHNHKAVCVTTECDPMFSAEIKNAAVSTTRIKPVKHHMYYNCNTGYITQGDRKTKCKASGKWTVPGMQCKDCGVPPNVDRATIQHNYTTTVASLVNYTCNVDREMFGKGHAECNDAGQWIKFPFGCLPPHALTYSGTCRAGYTNDALAGICYKIINTGTTWRSAMEACFSDDSKLLHLDTLEKMNLFMAVLPVNSIYHVGAHDFGHSGLFTWIDGTNVENIAWADNQQNTGYHPNGVLILRTEVDIRFYVDMYGEQYVYGFICAYP